MSAAIPRPTSAPVIPNGTLLAPGNANTVITAAGPIAVDATTTGNLWSAALAGALPSSSQKGDKTPQDSLLTNNAPPVLQQLLGLTTGASDIAKRLFGAGSNLGGSGTQATISAAGAATVNIVTQENTPRVHQ